MTEQTGIQRGLLPPEPTPQAAQHPTLAHEHSDVSVGKLFLTGAVLAAAIVLSCLAALWAFRFFAARERQRQPLFPLAAEENARPRRERIDGLPAPKLEGLYQEDKPSDRPDVRPVQLRAGQQPGLTTWSWVDKEHGVARIPIEAAMQEMVRRLEQQQPPGQAGRQPGPPKTGGRP